MKFVSENEAYQNLANAIITQAAKDYVDGYHRKECLNFFRSQWYSELTTVHGGAIIRECNKYIKGGKRIKYERN